MKNRARKNVNQSHSHLWSLIYEAEAQLRIHIVKAFHSWWWTRQHQPKNRKSCQRKQKQQQQQHLKFQVKWKREKRFMLEISANHIWNVFKKKVSFMNQKAFFLANDSQRRGSRPFAAINYHLVSLSGELISIFSPFRFSRRVWGGLRKTAD